MWGRRQPPVNDKGTTLLQTVPTPFYKSAGIFLHVLFSNLWNIVQGAKHEYNRSRGREQPHLAKMGLQDPVGRLVKEHKDAYGEEFEAMPEDMPTTILYKDEHGNVMSDALMRQAKTDPDGKGAVLPSGKRVNLVARSVIAVEGSQQSLQEWVDQFEVAMTLGADFSDAEIADFKLYKKQLGVEKGEKHVV